MPKRVNPAPHPDDADRQPTEPATATVPLPPIVDPDTGDITTASVEIKGDADPALVAAIAGQAAEESERRAFVRQEVIDAIERELEVILDPVDRARLARELVDLIGEIEDEEEDQVAQKASMKERLASLNSRKSKLVNLLRRGIEKRSVECDVVADWINGTATVRRKDTGEVVEGPRPLRESEKQLRLVPEVAAAAEVASVEHSAP